MKKNSESPQKSRRTFTKAVLTALVSAPVIPSVAAAQTGKTGQKPTASKRKKRPRTDHIPPITLRGGSLSIEVLHELDHRDGSDPRPEVYVAEGITEDTQYGYIAKVHVVTESLSGSAGPSWQGGFTTRPYPPGSGYFSEALQAQLWLWFVERPYNPNQPHVVIRGGPVPGQTLHTLVVESDKKFDKKNAHSTKRPHKYKHKGHDDEDYRIREWRIVRGNHNTLYGGSGDENYTLMIQFHHGVDS